MKFILFALLALPALLRAQEDCGDCPCGYELVEDPPNSGNFVCKQVAIVCPGVNRDYLPVGGKTKLCCPTKQTLVIYDDKTREGVCCAAGLVYVGDKPNGKCCTPGQVVIGGECATPVPPPDDGGKCCGSCPKQRAGACSLNKVCGTDKTNGLQYGHCYQLTFPDGTQLGRGLYGAVDQYIQNGYVQDIVFKVCKSTAANACGTGFLSPTDQFYIQDVTGSVQDTANTLSWIDNASNGAHKSLTTDATKAGLFTGKTSCSLCKCVVKINSLAYACPSSQPGITIWPNPNIGLDLQWTEIPCDGNFDNFPGN